MLAAQIAMRNLTQRMHAGVGATRALYRDALPVEARNRILDRTLHARRIGLVLPAAIGRAVIFDEEFVTWHQFRTEPR